MIREIIDQSALLALHAGFWNRSSETQSWVI